MAARNLKGKTMQVAAGALWRIEYRTDAARAHSIVIPIGYMLEAHWDGRARWLGASYREKLTRAELDVVNLKTWPELEDLERFVNGIFDRAWDATGFLGSHELALSFPIYSALHFAPEEFKLGSDDFNKSESYLELYLALVSFEDKLVPVLTAPVIPFEKNSEEIFLDDIGTIDFRQKKAAA